MLSPMNMKDVQRLKLLHVHSAPSTRRTVKCGGPGCSPYGNKDWKGSKPKNKKIDMRLQRVIL